MGSQFETVVAAVPENPDADWGVVTEAADRVRILIPWSGGLDSTTLVVMAVQAGFHVSTFAVTAGQPWDSGEARARHFIAEALPEFDQLGNQITMHLDKAAVVYDHIQVGRNAQIIHQLALLADKPEHDNLYEIWLGWLDGETTIASGDKSHFVLSHMQLTHPTIRLALPLRFMTKADLVRWWAKQNRVDDAAHLYSCFVGGTVPCGHCQACFRFFAGFAAAGYHEAIPWLGRIDFDAHLEKYEDKEYRSVGRERDMGRAIWVYRQLKGQISV